MSYDPTRQRGGQHVISPALHPPTLAPRSKRHSPAAAPLRLKVEPPLPHVLDDEDTQATDVTIRPSLSVEALTSQMLGLSDAAAKVLAQQWVKQGGDINGIDGSHNTPLMFAASHGLTATVAYWVGQGARVNAVNARGYTAFGMAAACGHVRMAAYLKSRGANPNVAAPWFDAAQQGSLRTLRILVDQGIDINLRDSQANTALHIAAHLGHIDTVHLLMSRGCDAALVNRRSQTRRPLPPPPDMRACAARCQTLQPAGAAAFGASCARSWVGGSATWRRCPCYASCNCMTGRICRRRHNRSGPSVPAATDLRGRRGMCTWSRNNWRNYTVLWTYS